MKNKILKMTTLYLSTRQMNALKEESKEKTITFSELIRRILDNHLDNRPKIK